MKHLQELGLDTNNASAFWCNPDRHGDWSLEFTDSCGGKIPQSNEYDEFCPAYTLQDVLDALPKMIYPFPVHKIGFELWIGSGKIFYANMFNLEDVLKVRYDKELIDAAYELLVWCIEKGYIPTVK